MSCQFNERVRETIAAKDGVYRIADVRSMLDQLAEQITGAVGQLAQGVPRESEDGRRLRTKVNVRKPTWQGNRLAFEARLVVEAKVLFGWPNVIEVVLKGTLEIKPSSTNRDMVNSLAVDIQLRFDAWDEAMPSVEKSVSEAAGHRINSCSAVQTELKKSITRYLTQLKDATRKGVRDLRGALG
ncbi:MAG: hypothetical protein JKY65_03955 [Planctomycetes bacterium]|nr:hypothetical protein [Planctomycetota bacterium]